MAIPVLTVDETGAHLPAYSDILSALDSAYRAIYGADVNLDPDGQDGQLLGIFALALSDTNAAALAAYNAFSPATAQGGGLSSVVKINGIARLVATNSTVDVRIVGQAGTTIAGGIVADQNGNQWNLPASVTIPPAGEITATATAQALGAIAAAPNTVTTIATPTRGWQSVNNPSAAAAGAPVETDATLRRRQSASTALPSLTVLDGIVGAVASVSGVTRYKAYENDTNTTDSDTLPPHSIAVVVEGGDSTSIATAIATKKTPGAYTYGTTAVTVPDSYGIPHVIRFFRPTNVTVSVAIQLRAFVGYTTAIETSIKQAIVDYLTALAIGDDVILTRLYVPANLSNGANGAAFEITSLLIAKSPATPINADITISFNEAATAALSNVTITVVP